MIVERFANRLVMGRVAFEQRYLSRKRAGFLVFFGQLSGRDLAGLHVRLIERIDADDRTRDGCGHFPAEKFLTQIVNVTECDSHNRLA